MKLDKDVAIIFLAGMLALVGTGIMTPAKAQSGTAPAVAAVAPSSVQGHMAAQASNAPAAGTSDGPDLDDDEDMFGDWTNPRYLHEERIQLCGMLLFFIAVGAGSARSRLSIRRQYRA